MGIPWLLAALPWGDLMKAATELVSRANARKTAPGRETDLNVMKDRITALEAQNQGDAELIRRLAEQVQALTGALAVVAARLRMLLLLAVGALVLAALALVLSLAM